MQHTPVDIAVLGGGMAGYHTALEAARLGRKVALVERRGFLGHELTATAHSWICNGSTPYEVFEAVGARKKLMLRALLDAGVQVLLLSTPAGIALQGQRACGVLVGNKFGLQWLRARHIVDTTPHASGYAQLGKALPALAGDVAVSYTFLIDNVRTQYETWLPVPASPGLADNKIRTHASLLPNTISIEMRYTVPGPIPALKRGGLEQQARLKALEVFQWLQANMPRYAEAHLLDLAGELLVPEAMETEAVEGMSRFPFRWEGDVSTDHLLACRQHAAALAASLTLEPPDNQTPVCFMLHGKPAAAWKAENAEGLPACLQKVRLELPEGFLPAVASQAAVAGAGSAGTLASLALLEKGVETVVLNPQHDAGGNRTLGRVSGNYFGFVEGVSGRLNEEVAALSAAIGGLGKSNDRIARILLYHQRLSHPSCRYLSGHTVCGVKMAGAKVKALWAANDDGLYEIQGGAFIDTTSDGDVAVFAGAKYEVGCPLDGTVMTNGQWGDSAWKLLRWTDAPYHTDFDVFHPDRYEELLRAITVAHGRNSDLDFSPFPNLRETRRIQGEYTLTLTDVLLKKPFSDLVAMACTPYDTHGIASSVLLRMGMLEFNENPIYVRLPYRCFLPQGIRGLLVGGKAPSATRDASSLFRMNADVENAGYALGLFAAQSLALGVEVGDVPAAPVQEELKRLGNLPQWAFDPPIEEKAALEALKNGESMGLLYTILQPKEKALPLVHQLYQSATDASLREKCAMALAFWGHPDGVDAVIQALEDATDITDPTMLLSPEGFGHKYIRWDGELGQYFRINRLITLLGVAADKRALGAILPYVEKAEAGGPLVKGEDTYHKSRLDKWCVPYFDRLLCLVFAMERLADPAAIEPLTALLHKPHISGYGQTAESFDESRSTSAWLELGLLRALARCGGAEGFAGLQDYAKDARAVFREHALSILKELSSTPPPRPETRLVIDG